ncbi:MAG: AAA family ATPase [Planctomycetota bacterium]|jgi:MoxR-like ATPase
MDELNTPEQVEAAMGRFGADVGRVREQVGRVIVGQREVVDAVLVALMCDGHVLLEGVPGLGKTLLVRTLADVLELEFSRVQFTPDLMPADITGTTVVHEADGRREFRFERGPVFTQLLLADEINRATPKTQSALLESMQERSVTVGGETHVLPRPFLVMATQNPIEQEGTYPLPEAQLDRFLMKVVVPGVSREEMGEILDRTTGGEQIEPERVLGAEEVMGYQRLVRRCAIAEHVRDYAVRLVMATQPGSRFASPMVEQYVGFGASPRGAQALVMAAKCLALLDGRPTASMDDIRAMARECLRHRVLMNFDASAEGVSSDNVIDNLLDTVPRDSD